MITAKDLDITRVRYKGRFYTIDDAFYSKTYAEEVAKHMRKDSYPGSTGNYRCRVVVVDLGSEAGRLRYGIFIAKGAKR